MTMDHGYSSGDTNNPQQRRARRRGTILDTLDVVGFFAGWLVLGGGFLAALTMDGTTIDPAANTTIEPGTDPWWTSVAAATLLIVMLVWLLVVYRIWQLRMRALAVASVKDRGGARRGFLAVAGVVAAGLLAAGCVLPPPGSDTAAPQIPGESSPAKQPAKKKAAAGIPGDGTFEVPGDVKPGTYKSEPGELGLCHWSRLRGTSGELDDIIANGNAEGPVTVTIKKTDRAFETSGCKTWRKAR